MENKHGIKHGIKHGKQSGIKPWKTNMENKHETNHGKTTTLLTMLYKLNLTGRNSASRASSCPFSPFCPGCFKMCKTGLED
jgi:hypothetical protein